MPIINYTVKTELKKDCDYAQFFITIYFYSMCMSVCMCVSCVPGAFGGLKKRVMDPPELELQMDVSCRLCGC